MWGGGGVGEGGVGEGRVWRDIFGMRGWGGREGIMGKGNAGNGGGGFSIWKRMYGECMYEGVEDEMVGGGVVRSGWQVDW